MLVKRIVTAVIALPLLLAAIIWLQPLWFAVLVGAAMLIGAWEWSLLSGFTSKLGRTIYVFCVAVGIVAAAFFAEAWVLLLAVVCWLWMLFTVIFYQYREKALGFQCRYARAFFGWVMLVSTWVAALTLRTYPTLGIAWLLIVLVLVFCADIGAFFAGRFWGKKLLCNRVSPKKTWIGLLGGLVLSLIMAGWMSWYFFVLPSQQIAFMLLALVTILFAVLGDLGVSVVKRIAGVKDSGKFFPGHGGMLDRLDSISAALVIFTLGVLLL
ncbi:MAG: hypothetical protein A3E84_05585 [Gammaproteobacteria bacterium RIFCSPHIGHO2_12_FULL_42_13]|nr:MAG: hypothetical protein A3E84_05585 [Gammaproteobacteria bacterium RIFCSPHIGHO2_12_FULL_42_13]